MERQEKPRRREEGTLGLTFVLDEVLHFLLDAVIPVGDVHMQGIVTAALPISPLAPLLIGLCQARLGLWHHVVNWMIEVQMGDLHGAPLLLPGLCLLA